MIHSGALNYETKVIMAKQLLKFQISEKLSSPADGISLD